MANEEQLRLLKEGGVKAWNAWRDAIEVMRFAEADPLLSDRMNLVIDNVPPCSSYYSRWKITQGHFFWTALQNCVS